MIPTIRVLSCLALLLLGSSAAGAPPPFPGAAKNYKAWTLAHVPGSPEGLAVDGRGRIFTALSDTGEIQRLEENGGYRHLATVPNEERQSLTGAHQARRLARLFPG
jgi:sugar lactone lactonase YvrE